MTTPPVAGPEDVLIPDVPVEDDLLDEDLEYAELGGES